MRHSKLVAVGIAAAGFALPAPLWAEDQLSLTGDARLSGRVLEIAEDGSVLLESELAPAALRLRGEAVRSIRFSEASPQAEVPDARLTLANGDSLAVAVEHVDEESLTVSSPVVGRLIIPRGKLAGLHLGMGPQEEIYRGPDPLANWQMQGNRGSDWRLEGGGFKVDGQGRMSREFDLPDQFILRFTLNWRNNPSFQLYFCDPLLQVGQRADRYMFQFGVSGMEIKRESSTGRQFTTIALITRQADQLGGNAVRVELRVDRSQSLVHLYLNGEYEGRFSDPDPNSPTAGGISLVSNAGGTTEQTVSDLQIHAWDATGDRHRTEDRGDASRDAVISRSADRFPGRLLGLRGESLERVFLFQSNFREEALELPESEISSVFFAETEPAADDGQAHPFLLRLRDGGRLRVISCAFADEVVTVNHPLLGPLRLDRAGVVAIERVLEAEEDESEE